MNQPQTSGSPEQPAAAAKRVCLIIPPSAFLLDERVFMTLGILKVAAVLEQRGHVVEMLDLSGVVGYEEAAYDHVCVSEAEVFGLTATTPQMPAATRICHAVRKARPAAKIIFGGPHVTLVNAACKRERQRGLPGRAEKAMAQLEALADVLVAGDGEEAVFVALKENAPRLIDADDPKSILFLDNHRLAELPFPARHLVDVSSYRYQIDNEPALSMIAQLGCPFACGFCGGRESPFLRRVRTRSASTVISEMTHMYNVYGIRGFMLYDDELNVNPKMIEMMQAISQAQRDLSTTFRLRGFIKAELFTDEQAASMFDAGFRWILTGFESGSPRILKNINKRATREDNTRCMEIARRHGLKVKALMSVGHPGESEETIRQTHEWLLEVRPDDFDVTVITTYPGTPYYDHAVPHDTESGVWTYTYQGDRLHAVEVDYTRTADYYKGDPDGGYHAFVYTDYLSSDDLVRLRDFVERDVRDRLGIPFNAGTAPQRYEHSMGQTGPLPASLLRVSQASSTDSGQDVTR